MENILREFIGTLDASFKKLVQETMESAGVSNLSVNQIQYIETIGRLGSPTVSEVATQLNISKASATAAINKLVTLGYAEKNQSSHDKRIYHVTLTEPSEGFIQLENQALKQYVTFISQSLSNEEKQQFEATLEKLVQGFYRKENI
ncbi:MarR family winged helix-turn-helix transcriptional regulator [Halobacillus salinus]|uniref:MarR family transcriptional regulator n=1 Tax=Halobacillus salinus TaxID=192814 RepID=A0A4Z0H247_9BACI|nr:MarR family transcriptional regulator [Halobacillus salinus]TGB03481.1 MarR family transcriptional regulator [Halobacillus salinus]